jgi:hypothetical protein
MLPRSPSPAVSIGKCSRTLHDSYTEDDVAEALSSFRRPAWVSAAIRGEIMRRVRSLVSTGLDR